MKPVTVLNLLHGFLLAGSPVVAGSVSNLATGIQTIAEARRVSTAEPHASATDAASATTSQLLPATVLTTNTLPPLPPGVTELKFNEFFRQPIGPRGLEYTDRLRSLEGRRIRILGYMVRQDKPAERCFLLSPLPLTLHEHEYGHADDLPATALHVITNEEEPALVPFTPGLLLLTGKLSLGHRLETDGRASNVRLFLDPPTPEQKQAVEQTVAATTKREPAAGQPSEHHGHAH